MQVQDVSIDTITQTDNSRLHYDKTELKGLMSSIKASGLLQPIGVTPDGNSWEVVYGNRRLIACEKLGWTDIPCVIMEEPEFEGEVELLNLTENMQRSQVTLKELGRYVQVLTAQGFTYGEMAVRLGCKEHLLKTAGKEFTRVPVEFRDKVIANMGTQNKPPGEGKLSLSTVNRIEKAAHAYGLSKAKKRILYKAGMVTGFQGDKAKEYAKEIMTTKGINAQDIVDEVNESERRCVTVGYFTGLGYETLREKFIDKGPFTSMAQVVAATFNREITHNVKMKSK